MSEPAMAPHTRRYRIGYALEPKKVQSVVRESLVDYANHRGIDLVQIEPGTPLIEQGLFDCVMHKLYTQDWKEQLDEYSAKHPNTVIVDRPELIEPLHSRGSMLEVVAQLRIPLESETIEIPKQVVINEFKAFDADNAIEELGLKFPLIAKPLLANGTDGSHQLRLDFDREGLKTLSTPVVLQEFVNHGGVVFKIYVAGQQVNCVKRKSLPDISEEMLKTLGGTLPFSQISNLTAQENEEDDGALRNIKKAEMPPPSLITELARALREALGLNLFNVDLIRDATDCRRYLVIDINYFPGYAKMPSYEPFFTDFLWDIVHKQTVRQEGELVIEKNNATVTMGC